MNKVTLQMSLLYIKRQFYMIDQSHPWHGTSRDTNRKAMYDKKAQPQSVMTSR